MRNFRPRSTHIPNIIKVGHTVPEICSGQKTMDGGRRTSDGTRRTDIWITKSLPELSSGETKMRRGPFFFSFFVFFCFFCFHFSKLLNFVLGLPKWNFVLTGKKHFTPGKKSGKMTLPPQKNYPVMPLGPPPDPYMLWQIYIQALTKHLKTLLSFSWDDQYLPSKTSHTFLSYHKLMPWLSLSSNCINFNISPMTKNKYNPRFTERE